MRKVDPDASSIFNSNQKESLIEELNQKLQTALENLDAEKAENQIIYQSFALRTELCGFMVSSSAMIEIIS